MTDRTIDRIAASLFAFAVLTTGTWVFRSFVFWEIAPIFDIFGRASIVFWAGFMVIMYIKDGEDDGK